MHLCPISRLGRCTATPLERIAPVSVEMQISKQPDHRFTSEHARRHAPRARPHSVSLLALKPMARFRHTSDPSLGGGARLAQAAREESPINSTTTEEVER
jgi:hypothetical protein